MKLQIREYTTEDAKWACEIWNQVVRDGIAFPQEETLTPEEGDVFFKEQTFTGIAVNEENGENGEIVGLYILHPNNVGRCGHICNASYAVRISGENILEKLWYWTVYIRQRKKALEFYSLMRLWHQIYMHYICIKESVLCRLA